MDADDALAAVRSRWPLLLVVLAAVIVVGGLLATLAGNTFGATPQASYDQQERLGGVAPDTTAGEGGDAGAGEFVEVQEAAFDIDTGDVEAASDQVEDLVESNDGYVEERNKREGTFTVDIDMTVRVPDSRFTAFTSALRDEYDVESYSVQNYRVSVAREIDELEILNRTLSDYERIRQRILARETTTENLELLSDLTEKELWVLRQKRDYQRELESARQRGEYATVQITLTQQKAVEVVPENIGNRFNKAVKDMMDSIVSIVIGTMTGAVVLFFQVLQALVYLVVVGVPLLLAYRYGRRIYRRYWRRDDGD